MREGSGRMIPNCKLGSNSHPAPGLQGSGWASMGVDGWAPSCHSAAGLAQGTSRGQCHAIQDTLEPAHSFSGEIRVY